MLDSSPFYFLLNFEVLKSFIVKYFVSLGGDFSNGGARSSVMMFLVVVSLIQRGNCMWFKYLFLLYKFGFLFLLHRVRFQCIFSE